MGDQSDNRGLERSGYGQLRRLIWVLGSVSVMLAMRVMPAIAAELTQWGYDSQTRSLTLVISATVTPTVSVLSDNQLLIELPDTQVGDVLGQRVNDGVVDSIVVKQTSPDTVWMVVAFLPGTVLAGSQAIAPIGVADAIGPNLQQWQVRPALLSSSSASTQANTQANTQAIDSNNSRQPEISAIPRDLAQLPDFPNLPVLEPANPIDAPVSVPLPVNLLPASLPSVNQPSVNQPLVNQPLVNQQPSNFPAAVADNDGLPSLVSIPAVSVPTVSVPAISTPLEAQPVETVLETTPIQSPVGQVPLPSTPTMNEPVVAEPVASEPAVVEPVAAEPVAAEPVAAEPVAAEPVAAPEPLQPVAEIVPSPTEEAAVPVEPPFIGALGDLTVPIPLSDDLIEADESPALPAPLMPLMPSVVAEPAEPFAEPVAIEPAEPSVEPVAELSVPVEALSANIAPLPTPIAPANVNRWPDPIPFGQPLP